MERTTSSQPHILYVGATLPARSETFVYREVLGLRARGVRVSVASVHPPERDLKDPELDALASEAHVVYGCGPTGKLSTLLKGVRARPWGPTRGLLETRPGYWPKYVLQCRAGQALAHRLRDRGVTHVHAHMAHVPTTIAMHCAEALGVPFSFTGHAADLFRDRAALKTKLRRAAFVACISEWHRSFYADLTGLPPSRLPIVRCGVDLDSFDPIAPVDGRSILGVGRLVPKKGFDVAIRALPQVEGAVLTLVGDGPEAPRLRALAEEVGVAERVVFAGAQPNERVRQMLKEAALFVLPCRLAEDGDRDGIPVALMEAMARQVCVVSGDLPTIRELVVDGVSGVMVPPGQVDPLVASLRRLLSTPALRNRLAEGGRARVAQEFSLAVNLDRLQAAFAASG